MKPLSYETTRGKIRTVQIEERVADNVYRTKQGQYLTIEGERVLSSSNGSKPRHVGYVA